MGAGKKVFVLAFLIAAISALFLLYIPTANVASEKIGIGVSLPLTGAASHLGGWAMQGIEIAQDEEGFALDIQDDQCQGQRQ